MRFLCVTIVAVEKQEALHRYFCLCMCEGLCVWVCVCGCGCLCECVCVGVSVRLCVGVCGCARARVCVRVYCTEWIMRIFHKDISEVVTEYCNLLTVQSLTVFFLLVIFSQ
jgi:hypothetical protein